MRRSIRTILRIFIAGCNNFVRNAWLSITAMAVMLITLTIILVSIIANATFSNTISDVRDKIDISVFLKDNITPQQREQLVTEIKATNSTKSIEYISKEQALELYKEQNKDNINLQTAISLTDNPLPASLRIKPVDPDNIQPIKEVVDKKENKDLQSANTSYSGDRKEAIDKIAKATSLIKRIGFIGVVTFAVISVLIIFNTIQMAIFDRRDELSIMRLLGASRNYIRGPFLVESFLIGVASAVLSIAICNAMFSVASETLGANSFGLLDLAYSSDYFANNFWKIVGLQLSLGAVIAVGSSFIATGRYLRLRSEK
jgi:cell division transport system permease protein